MQKVSYMYIFFTHVKRIREDRTYAWLCAPTVLFPFDIIRFSSRTAYTFLFGLGSDIKRTNAHSHMHISIEKAICNSIGIRFHEASPNLRVHLSHVWLLIPLYIPLDIIQQMYKNETLLSVYHTRSASLYVPLCYCKCLIR